MLLTLPLDVLSYLLLLVIDKALAIVQRVCKRLLLAAQPRLLVLGNELPTHREVRMYRLECIESCSEFRVAHYDPNSCVIGAAEMCNNDTCWERTMQLAEYTCGIVDRRVECIQGQTTHRINPDAYHDKLWNATPTSIGSVDPNTLYRILRRRLSCLRVYEAKYGKKYGVEQAQKHTRSVLDSFLFLLDINSELVYFDESIQTIMTRNVACEEAANREELWDCIDRLFLLVHTWFGTKHYHIHQTWIEARHALSPASYAARLRSILHTLNVHYFLLENVTILPRLPTTREVVKYIQYMIKTRQEFRMSFYDYHSAIVTTIHIYYNAQNRKQIVCKEYRIDHGITTRVKGKNSDGMRLLLSILHKTQPPGVLSPTTAKAVAKYNKNPIGGTQYLSTIANVGVRGEHVIASEQLAIVWLGKSLPDERSVGPLFDECIREITE